MGSGAGHSQDTRLTHTVVVGVGYRLTTSGYDFLALRAVAARDSIASVGNQIGVGKESDIYIVANGEHEQLAMKLHRLGRASFRTIKKNRDYHRGRKHVSWLYLASLAAKKEYAYMKVLFDHGFPVPRPVDCNRCAIIMELLDSTPLHIVKKMERPDEVYSQLMELIVRMANYGLVHCDFNEFNLLVSKVGVVTLIDFPQMVSTDHFNAEFFFDRDVECIRVFFERRFNFKGKNFPRFHEVVRTHTLDAEVSASGFDKDDAKEFNELQAELAKHEAENPTPGEGDSDGSGISDDDSSGDEGDEGSHGGDAEIGGPHRDTSTAGPADQHPADTSVAAPAAVAPPPAAAAAAGVATPVEASPSADAADAVEGVAAPLKPLSFRDPTALAPDDDDDSVAAALAAAEAHADGDEAHESDENGDAALDDLETGNRDFRAFRNPERVEAEEAGISIKSSVDPTTIRDKVRKTIAQRAKMQAQSKSKKKGGKTQVTRGEKKERKGKTATKIDW